MYDQREVAMEHELTCRTGPAPTCTAYGRPAVPLTRDTQQVPSTEGVAGSYQTQISRIQAHINKAWITADTCAHLVARLHGALKLCVLQDLGEDHFLPFFEPLDELANISSLTLALQTLQASMHTHLVYPHGLNSVVYAGIVPLVQGRNSGGLPQGGGAPSRCASRDPNRRGISD